MSFKGMGLYMEDRETYLRLYLKDHLLRATGRGAPGSESEAIELDEPTTVDLNDLGGPP
jgi:hypothetical protein